jgi:hypothetical protein
MKLGNLIVGLFVWGGCGGEAIGGKGSSGDSGRYIEVSTKGAPVCQSALRFRIESMAPVMRTGKAIFEGSITNVSNVPIWLNTRFAFGSSDDIGLSRDVWVSVRGGNGKSISPARCISDPVPSWPEHYRALRPGQSLKVEGISLDCFNIEKSGTYFVTAFYEDGNTDPPSAPEGSIRCAEIIKSAEIEVKLK